MLKKFGIYSTNKTIYVVIDIKYCIARGFWIEDKFDSLTNEIINQWISDNYSRFNSGDIFDIDLKNKHLLSWFGYLGQVNEIINQFRLKVKFDDLVN